MTTLEYAMAYLDRGFSVIPLKSPSMVNGSSEFQNKLQKAFKENEDAGVPRTEEEIFQELVNRFCKQPLEPWKEYQVRRPTRKEVTNWFTRYPDANIGIVTGAVSNLVVFDLDSEDAVWYAEDQGGFPFTPKVKSGKGYHIYIEHPGFEVRNDVKQELKIDIRGDGGYIVAPPSIHGSGHSYIWTNGNSIIDDDPAPCEEWMIKYLEEVNSNYKTYLTY